MAKKTTEITTSQVTFTGNFQQVISGELKPGAEVTILFDPNRLPFERSLDKKGKPAWIISAFYQFSPDGTVNEIKLVPEKVSAGKKGAKVETEPFLKGEFTVPEGSEVAIIWFRNSGTTGKEYYDSDFGKNYRFPITPVVSEKLEVEPAPKKRAKKA